MTTQARNRLIEVALPLDAINAASAREKSIRHGHPSTLRLWWTHRPSAAARSVIFAQMVQDPSPFPDLFPAEKKQTKECNGLFRIIEDGHWHEVHCVRRPFNREPDFEVTSVNNVLSELLALACEPA